MVIVRLAICFLWYIRFSPCLETFQNFTDNIAIGITHTDLLSESTKSTTIYKDWLLQNDLFSPLFFIDARKKDDVLLLLEALITSIEINSNIAN